MIAALGEASRRFRPHGRRLGARCLSTVGNKKSVGDGMGRIVASCWWRLTRRSGSCPEDLATIVTASPPHLLHSGTKGPNIKLWGIYTPPPTRGAHEQRRHHRHPAISSIYRGLLARAHRAVERHGERGAV